MSTGLNFTHSITGSHKVETTVDSSMKALSVKNEATTTWDLIAGTQANIKAPMVAVGQSPAEPMVMGTQLSTFLQTFLNTFISNAAFITTGNLGAPTPANPAIITALTQLVAQIPTLTSKTITLAP